MDDTLTYIKMCEKSEIQKMWKPKDGDFVYHPDDGEEAFGRHEFPAEFRVVILSDIQTENWWQNWLWLPRQDQLQDIIIFKFGDNTISLLKDFTQFTRVCYAHGKYYSMEQLWLAFVMKEKYQKTWNGKEWK